MRDCKQRDRHTRAAPLTRAKYHPSWLPLVSRGGTAGAAVGIALTVAGFLAISLGNTQVDCVTEAGLRP